MSIELARRLLGNGAPAGAVEVALMAEAMDGVPFVQALVERFPELVALFERELERADAFEVQFVRPLPELLEGLPRGMCQRLLAVPIRRDLESGRVDVAAVDALGPHVAAEFSFHLGSKVRVLRARLSELSAALRTLADSQAPARMPSDSPIPLVRRPSFLKGSEPGTHEPMLALTRAKLVPAEFAFESSLDEALAEIVRAESAEQVSRLLCGALEPSDVLLVAVRSKGFDARAVSRSLLAGDASNLSLALGKNSVFEVALRTGFFLGPLSPGLMHSELRSLLSSEAREEVYSAPVVVAGRPVLVLLMARFGPSLVATGRADKLLRAAGSTIERLLLAKKRES